MTGGVVPASVVPNDAGHDLLMLLRHLRTMRRDAVGSPRMMVEVTVQTWDYCIGPLVASVQAAMEKVAARPDTGVQDP